jgi:hypothetical protein
MSREEQFIKKCITLPFEEKKDDRDEMTVPELAKVARLRDEGSFQESIDYGQALIKMYPDFDLIPFMLAYIYYQKDFPLEARKLAVEAIPKCARKYRLYSVAGLAEFIQDKLPEAIVWWAWSTIAQCTISDFQEYDPFLYLAYAAEIIGAQREADIFFTMVDAIESSQPRLDDSALKRLSALNNSWVRKPLIQVLKYIDKQYLHS